MKKIAELVWYILIQLALSSIIHGESVGVKLKDLMPLTMEVEGFGTRCSLQITLPQPFEVIIPPPTLECWKEENSISSPPPSPPKSVREQAEG